MNLFTSSRNRDLELLSAYLDNQLAPAERAKLERRLATDSRLRATLGDLQGVKTTLAALPRVKPPRNFTLTPKLIEAHGLARPASPFPRLLPAVNVATALVAVLFAVVITADLGGGFYVAAPAQPSAAQVENFQVAEAPEADSQAAEALPSEASPKLATETADVSVALAPPVEAEPLTGETGGGGGAGPGVGGGAATGSGTGNADGSQPDSFFFDETATAEAVSSAPGLTLAERSTPDSGLRTRTETETPEAVSQAVAQETVQPAFPARAVELGLGVILIILITASFLLRRR